MSSEIKETRMRGADEIEELATLENWKVAVLEEIKKIPASIENEMADSQNVWTACFKTQLGTLRLLLDFQREQSLDEINYKRAVDLIDKLGKNATELAEKGEPNPPQETRNELLQSLDDIIN